MEACLALMSAFAFMASGCTSTRTVGFGAQSPERQSDTEYALAKEYFYKSDPRVALDHALKAVQLSGDNSRALYFTSTLFLYFCSTNQGMTSPDCRLADAEK
jgi:Tfp pilus assembly protein PilF